MIPARTLRTPWQPPSTETTVVPSCVLPAFFNAVHAPAALGAYTALKAAGKEKSVMIVSVDGGCTGTRAVRDGKIAATSQQYPLKMASTGVDAVVDYAKSGKKASGYTDTGVNLITAKPVPGVPSKDVQFGLANCWG